MICKCKRFVVQFEYTDEVGYATDLCGPYCDGVYHAKADSHARIAGMEAENAKLRELLRLSQEMYLAHQAAAYADERPMELTTDCHRTRAAWVAWVVTHGDCRSDDDYDAAEAEKARNP